MSRYKKKFLLILSLLLLSTSLLFAFTIFTDPSGQGFPRRYLDGDIPFVYQVNQTAPAEYIPAIDAGAQVWEDLESAYWEFENGGLTPVNTDQLDGTNLVFFDFQGVNFSPGTNAIAYSRTWTAGSGFSYHATESDLVWNARDFPPSPTGAAGQQDLQSVIAHEFGHHLGLGHSGNVGGPPGVGPTITQATMYGTSASGDTSKRSLHIDDIAGVSAIYPVWKLEGTVTDAVTGLPVPGAAVTSDIIWASEVRAPILYSNIWQQPGYFQQALPVDNSGDYAATALKQNFILWVEFYGYNSSQTVPVAFNPAGGIGQTQTQIQDFQIQPSSPALISGTLVDSLTATSIVGRIAVYAISDKPGTPVEAVADTITDNNGAFQIQLPSAENYRIEVYPRSPYPPKEVVVTDLPVNGAQLNFDFNPADILLVDDDGGADYETYYMEAISNLSRTYHHWNVTETGSPTALEMAEYPSKTVVWFTGDGLDSTLNQNEQNQIRDHRNNGGKILITGQNIAEQLNGSDFLNNLGIGFVSNNAFLVVLGVEGDFTAGQAFSTIGSGGAGNQTSKDQLIIQDSSMARTVLTYGSVASATAGAAIEQGVSRMVFLGFGWEAVSTSEFRESLLNVILNYFDDLTSIDNSQISSVLPENYHLMQNYPNPFNPRTAIRFAVPEYSKVRIVIYNALGQKIRTLTDRDYAPGYHQIMWNGLDDLGVRVSSGVYFYQMSNEGTFSQSRKLVLMK